MEEKKYLNCSSFLGSNYVTVKSVFLNDDGDYTAVDTDVLSFFPILMITRQDKYNTWYESMGSQASAACKNRTKELLCSDYFPPCHSAEDYAIFPCRENCQQYKEYFSFYRSPTSICQSAASPLICPADGPDPQSSSVSNGMYPLSNNALWSCFHSDLSIEPYLRLFPFIRSSHCLFTPFMCGNNTYHPECTHVSF